MQRSERLYEWKRRNHLQRQVLGDGDNGFLSRLISLKKIFIILVMSMSNLSDIEKKFVFDGTYFEETLYIHV